MNIARILYPVEVLGPGRRIGIWFAGCSHHCTGCSNPELWEMKPEYEITVDQLVDVLYKGFAHQHIDGFVLTGGDPFIQSGDLARLLSQIRGWTNDILVYTGYTYGELMGMHDPHIEQCLSDIDVLVDGRYVESLNDGSPLRGSSNQRIIYFRPELGSKYEAYMAVSGNKIQNFTSQNGIISVGIHKPGFTDDIRERALQKGLVIKHE